MFVQVDWMGGNALKEVSEVPQKIIKKFRWFQIYTEMRARQVLVYFAAAKGPVLDFFQESGFYKFVPKHNFYPTIRDAVAIAMKRRNAFVFSSFYVPSLKFILS